ncbi:MAG: FtsX-like permease family protein [Luteitalea sp.]|nr:FtsX-like permease family protein [Luteitalea sp.]
MFAHSLAQDARYACRGARRSPLFAISVAGTIGVGLGVLCSWFTIVNAYLFKAVRLPQPTELHGLSWDSSAQERYKLTLAEFEALAADNPVFARLAAGNSVIAAMPSGQSMAGHLVTGEYFAVLGAPAALGRLLTPADFTSSAVAPVVVLSDVGWRRYFNADPSIVGKEIVLAGARLTVSGVTRPGATLPGDEAIGFWAPLSLTTTFGLPTLATSQERSLFVVGRRRAAATADQVRAWFETWVRQRFAGTELEPVRTRTDSLATRVPLTRATLTLFMLLTAAFGLVLLIACVNVANMLLARGLSRQRELGIRISLGASRWRLIQQLLIESSVLAVPAAGVALLCTFATAWGFPRLVTSTMPAGAEVLSQILAPYDPDIRVLTVLVAAGWLAALLAGLSPAIQLTRTSLVAAMRGQIGSGGRVSRLRSVFVTVQVATCVLFLVAALAFVAESRRMGSAETGLDYERIVTVQAPTALRPAIAAELAARADVAAVSATWRPPLISPMSLLRVTAEEGVTQTAGFMVVSPDYFDALGVRVLRGREFTRAEAEQHAALILVSHATARLFWPGRDPIGQKLDIAPPLTDHQRQPAVTRATVIGVVEDVVNGTLLDGVARTSVYFPTTAADPEARWLLVRTRGDAAVGDNRIAKALRDTHPATALDVAALRQHAAVQVWAFRAFSTASSLPAAIGLLLAFVGVYGVVAFVMTQRTREFGIRMALGATSGRIVRNVVGSAIRTATLAAVLGLLGTAGIMRGVAAISNLRPVISPSIYIAGVVIVVVAAALASLIPAMRVTNLDPSSTLRAD